MVNLLGLVTSLVQRFGDFDSQHLKLNVNYLRLIKFYSQSAGSIFITRSEIYFCLPAHYT